MGALDSWNIRGQFMAPQSTRRLYLSELLKQTCAILTHSRACSGLPYVKKWLIFILHPYKNDPPGPHLPSHPHRPKNTHLFYFQEVRNTKLHFGQMIDQPTILSNIQNRGQKHDSTILKLLSPILLICYKVFPSFCQNKIWHPISCVAYGKQTIHTLSSF